MTADLVPFPGRRHTADDAHAALRRFLLASMSALASTGAATPADLPDRERALVDRAAAEVVALLAELGPVLPGVGVVDGELAFEALP